MSPRHSSNREAEFERRLGALAARLREERGVSQATLADELGHDQSFVSKVEHAQRRLTVGEFLRWAAALGISFRKLTRELELLWSEFIATESIWEREKRRSRGH